MHTHTHTCKLFYYVQCWLESIDIIAALKQNTITAPVIHITNYLEHLPYLRCWLKAIDTVLYTYIILFTST